MKSVSANGKSGHLLRSEEGYFFREYNADGTFNDYRLDHTDLYITINDEDAFLYETLDQNEYNTLDHSPETLGLKAE